MSLMALAVVLLVACETIHTEAEARTLADKAFHEYIVQKKINQSQYKEPRLTYNTKLEVWEAYYEWIGPPDAENGVNVLIDKFGRIELHAMKP